MMFAYAIYSGLHTMLWGRIKIGKVFSKYFGDKNAIDLEIPEQGKPHCPMDFDE
jgi:hypothetical protein